MKRALIMGSTGGVGRALMAECSSLGWHTTGLSRSGEGFDYTDLEHCERLLSALEVPFDCIIVATGALSLNGVAPEKSLGAVTPAAMMAQFQVNTIGPALVLKHAKRLLPRASAASIVTLSARVGSIGDNALGGWLSYRTAKAALNQVVKTAAIELARTHPLAACIALHPGTVETPFTQNYAGRHAMIKPQEAASKILAVASTITSERSGQFVDNMGRVIAF